MLTMRPSKRGVAKRGVRGVSLVEVLVSILLASVGLLALVGSNVASIRFTKMSQYRGTATLLANDIGERMRANKAGLASYVMGDTFSAQAAVPTLTAGELCNSYAQTCTAAQLANYDLKTWQILVRDQLPEGSVSIAIQAAQSAADVWLVWRDPSVANNDDLATTATECPNGLNLGTDTSIRCSYFRINL